MMRGCHVTLMVVFLALSAMQATCSNDDCEPNCPRKICSSGCGYCGITEQGDARCTGNATNATISAASTDDFWLVNYSAMMLYAAVAAGVLVVLLLLTCLALMSNRMQQMCCPVHYVRKYLRVAQALGPRMQNGRNMRRLHIFTASTMGTRSRLFAPSTAARFGAQPVPEGSRSNNDEGGRMPEETILISYNFTGKLDRVELCMTLKSCATVAQFDPIVARSHQTNVGTAHCLYVVRKMRKEVKKNAEGKIINKTSWVHEEVVRGCFEIHVLAMNLYPPTGKDDAQQYVEDTNSGRQWIFHKVVVTNNKMTTCKRLRLWKWEEIVLPKDNPQGQSLKSKLDGKHKKTPHLKLSANMHKYQVVLLSVGNAGKDAPAIGPMAEMICEALSRAGINVWSPPRRLVLSLATKHPDINATAFAALLHTKHLKSSHHVAEDADEDLLQLATAVATCEAFVPLLTDGFVELPLCQAMLRAAKYNFKKNIIPIVCDVATPKRTDAVFRRIKPTLNSVPWLYNTSDKQGGTQRLINSLMHTLSSKELARGHTDFHSGVGSIGSAAFFGEHLEHKAQTANHSIGSKKILQSFTKVHPI